MQKQSRLKIGLTPKNHLENESWNIIWWKWYIELEWKCSWRMHDMYVYCTYGIVLEYDSKKKQRLQEKYFQNDHKCIWFILGRRILLSDSKKDYRISTFKIVKYFWFSWAGRKWFGIRLKQFRFFGSGSSLFFSNQSLHYRKGQQNCNFRFPTPWSRCIILAHSSLVS